jgi:predicted Zn-dependent protease with MMP-like domain
LDDKAFDGILKDTLASLPGEIRAALDTVQVTVMDWPTPRHLDNGGLAPDDTLYGIFEGVSLPEKTYPDTQIFPDRVVVFRGPLEEDFPDPRDLEREIRLTLLHELGHYFGFTEEDLKKRGYQ